MNSSSKKYIIQFLPKKLEELSNSKNFTFDGEKLKSSYVVDLIHNLIFKYFYTKENSFPLSSTILKEKYGYLYNYYIDYLVEKNVLSLIKKHQKGVSSRIYRLNDTILNDRIIRFKNCDTTLLKKRRNYIFNNSNQSESPIEKNIRNKLIQDLYSVKIDFESSSQFLHSFERDKDILTRNLLTIESISDGDLFYHFDTYGRFHTNFTILKSFIRKNFLRIDGEPTVEIDIKNSQPLFLNKIIQNTNSDLLNDDEVSLYSHLTLSGGFYKYLQEQLGINEKKMIKDIVYKIFFGKNYATEYDKKFKSVFPKIYGFIRNFKKNHKDYKSLSYELQRLESNFIFNKVINHIYNNHPNIKIITCHDSLICKQSDSDIVNLIFEEFLNEEFDLLSSKSLMI